MTIYLDNAATTRMLPVALQAYVEQASRVGNPSSVHSAGQASRSALEGARADIASSVGADPIEVVFTSGGTESINLGIKGIYWSRRAANPRRTIILVPEGEHHATIESVDWLEAEQGAEVHWLKLDGAGRVSVADVERELSRNADRVNLVSLMWANNEVGTIQPVAEVVAAAKAFGVPTHIDGVSAFGQLPFDLHALGAAAISVSAHKVGGPVGIGALLLGRFERPEPLMHGGGQERKVRSGTVDTAAAAAFAAAVRENAATFGPRVARMRALRDRLILGIEHAVTGAVLQGDPDHRLPSNAHFVFEGCEGDSLLFLLDVAGVEASTGSACTAGVPQPSHVLLAMGLDEEQARGALRFTLGPDSTEADVDGLLDVLPGIVAQARRAGLAAHVPKVY